jgi:hypothetical protein
MPTDTSIAHPVLPHMPDVVLPWGIPIAQLNLLIISRQCRKNLEILVLNITLECWCEVFAIFCNKQTEGNFLMFQILPQGFF